MTHVWAFNGILSRLQLSSIGVDRMTKSRRKYLYWFLVGVLVFLSPQMGGIAWSLDDPSEVQALSEDAQRVAAICQPACVAVSRYRNESAGFSAVIVSQDGDVLTAGHCIEPGRDYFVHLNDGQTLPAKSLGKSEFLDVGLIKITEDAAFPHVEMKRSGELVRNQPLLSISHPGGLSSERGLVTRLGRLVAYNSRGHLHNTCLMEPGDSGGGLFDLDGCLIGIIVGKNSCVGNEPIVFDSEGRRMGANVMLRDEANDLVFLRVDANFAKAIQWDPSPAVVSGLLISPQPLEARGFVSWMGSRRFDSALRPNPGFLGVRLGIQSENRVIVTGEPTGPAKEAELLPNDAILRINEVPIVSVSQMVETIRSFSPGETVQLTIQRASEEQSVSAILTSPPRSRSEHVADQFEGGPSLRHTGFEQVFCHDAHVTPDQCGGPVFDLSGRFVGLNIARFSRTHCYAISVETVRRCLDRAIALEKLSEEGLESN